MLHHGDEFRLSKEQIDRFGKLEDAEKNPRNRILEKAWKMPEGWNASLDALAGLLVEQGGQREK